MSSPTKGTQKLKQGLQHQLDFLTKSQCDKRQKTTAEDEKQLQEDEREQQQSVRSLKPLYSKIDPLLETIHTLINSSRRELLERRAQTKRMKDLQIYGKNLLGDKGEVRIGLLGKTGTGKSLLGNNLLKEVAFVSKGCFTSITKKSKIGRRRLDDQTSLLVVDTPGLFDTVTPNAETTKEIVRSITLAAPGPHIYIFAIAIGRFTPEEVNTITYLQQMLGEQAIDHVIVVFTRKEELGDTDFKHFLADCQPVLLELLEKCNNRFAFINNKADPDALREDVDVILDVIFRTIGKNQGAFYTNSMYEKAEKRLEIRRKEIKKEQELFIVTLTENRKQLLEQMGGQMSQPFVDPSAHRMVNFEQGEPKYDSAYLKNILERLVSLKDIMDEPKRTNANVPGTSEADSSTVQLKQIFEQLGKIEKTASKSENSQEGELSKIEERLANLERNVSEPRKAKPNVTDKTALTSSSKSKVTVVSDDLTSILERLENIDRKMNESKGTNQTDAAKMEDDSSSDELKQIKEQLENKEKQLSESNDSHAAGLKEMKKMLELINKKMDEAKSSNQKVKAKITDDTGVAAKSDDSNEAEIRKMEKKLDDIDRKIDETKNINPNVAVKKEAEEKDDIIYQITKAVIGYGLSTAGGAAACAVGGAATVASKSLGWLKSWWQ